MKPNICIFLVAVALFSSACTSAQIAPAITPTTTATLTTQLTTNINSPLSPVIHSPIVTPTSPPPTEILKPTPAPTPTPLPVIVWKQPIKQFNTLQSPAAIWSPVANELLLYSCNGETRKNAIVRLDAPNFEPIDLTPTKNFACPDTSRTIDWSPDGQTIICNNQVEQKYSVYSQIWLMDREGHNPHSTNVSGRTLSFFRWEEPQTVLYASYGGSGYTDFSKLNIKTGENFYVTSSNSRSDFNNDFFAFTQVSIPDTVYAYAVKISQSDKGKEHKFPNHKVEDGFVARSYFVQWLPNTSQALVKMLLLEEGHNFGEDTPLSQLVFWDLDTDNIATVIPNAIDGRFSPNGKLLAYLTYIPTWPGTPIETITLAENQQETHRRLPYLQLVDLSTKKVTLSLPSSEAPPGWFPAAWSPDSQKFVYWDDKNNVNIFNTSNNITTPITKSEGERVSNPKWSFDGKYLSFEFKDSNYSTKVGILSTS